MARVLVINPNSNPGVTRGIDEALEPLRGELGATIDVIGLRDTPYGIESQRDVDAVAGPIAACVAGDDAGAGGGMGGGGGARRGAGGGGGAGGGASGGRGARGGAGAGDATAHDAYVIACYSDPGLSGAREVTAKPVLGIASAGLLTALAIGNAVGVISILATSLPRHWRMYRAMGVAQRVVADMPVGASVEDLADADAMGDRMTAVGRRLIEDAGADVLVLGCAGMAHYRESLERELGVAVVDPTQAAVGMAITAAALGYRTS